MGRTIKTFFNPILERLIIELSEMGEEQKITAINQAKLKLHEISPMKGEPVDCVLWVKSENIEANDYNPNSVAPPEMELLKISILEDGYTQPIVTFKEEEKRIVIDGFHRNRVGKECEEVKTRIKGYLPVVTINENRLDRGDKIAATIRHNRARGKHKIEAMSDIVIELKRRNWSDEKIAKNLGMEADEVLRLCQISGLAELFMDEAFSKSWDIDEIDEDTEIILEDN